MGVITSILDRSISGRFDSDVFNIRPYAFKNCTGLTSVFFRRCYSIGDEAFSGCSSLTDIYVGLDISTVCILGTDAFRGCDSLTSIHVPSFLVDSYKSATNWSEYADKIK